MHTLNTKSMDNVRMHLIEQMEKSYDLTEFDVAETLLVMYDTGVVDGYENEEGEIVFEYNTAATEDMQIFAERTHASLHNAGQDVWNSWVYGGLN